MALSTSAMRAAKVPRDSSASALAAAKTMARRRSIEEIKQEIEEAFDLSISPYRLLIGIPLNSSYRLITPTID